MLGGDQTDFVVPQGILSFPKHPSLVHLIHFFFFIQHPAEITKYMTWYPKLHFKHSIFY